MRREIAGTLLVALAAALFAGPPAAAAAALPLGAAGAFLAGTPRWAGLGAIGGALATTARQPAALPAATLFVAWAVANAAWARPGPRRWPGTRDLAAGAGPFFGAPACFALRVGPSFTPTTLALLLALTPAAELLAVATVWRRVGRTPPGWRWPGRRAALLGIAVGLGLAGGLTGLTAGLHALGWAATDNPFLRWPALRTAAAPIRLGVAVVIAGVAPLTEEALFRGTVHATWAHWAGRLGGVAAALLFGAAHGVPLLILPLAAAGAVLAALYDHTASLWPGILAHAVLNTIAVVVTFAS